MKSARPGRIGKRRAGKGTRFGEDLLAYLKISDRGSSRAALVSPPPPSSFPVYVSQLESGLCLEINKLAPLSAWDFPLSGDTHKPPPERRCFFPAAGELWGKEGGLVGGQIPISCLSPSVFVLVFGGGLRGLSKISNAAGGESVGLEGL